MRKWWRPLEPDPDRHVDALALVEVVGMIPALYTHVAATARLLCAVAARGGLLKCPTLAEYESFLAQATIQ